MSYDERQLAGVMEQRLAEHAAIAARLFQRTPHPGMDEPEPTQDVNGVVIDGA